MPELFPEDQEKVDRYLKREQGDDREMFKPLRLLAVLFAVLMLLTLIGYLITRIEGLI